MKTTKLTAVLAVLVTTSCLAFSGCEAGTSGKIGGHTPVTINPSPDKYTYYVKDYVGKNCASLGDAQDGKICDETGYGAGEMKLNLISTDKSFIDVEDGELLKKYCVISQSIEPNTEVKLSFKTIDGEEMERWVTYQSIEEIDLYISLIE